MITQQQCLINDQARELAKFEEILESDKRQSDAYQFSQCSPTDSGLEVDVAAGPGDDSDSYITMSDSSVMTDNEGTSDKLCKPVMREFYKNKVEVDSWAIRCNMICSPKFVYRNHHHTCRQISSL